MTQEANQPDPSPSAPLPQGVRGERRPRRWWIPRVRFSLRTLLLIVLLIASCATLWWNWEPWRIAAILAPEGEVRDACYSDDDRYILLITIAARVNGSRDPRRCVVEIRDANSGALLRTVRDHGTRWHLVPSGVFVQLMSLRNTESPVIINLDSGQRVSDRTNVEIPLSQCSGEIDFQKTCAVLRFPWGMAVVRLPGFEFAARIVDCDLACLSESEEFVAARQEKKILFLSTGQKNSPEALELGEQVIRRYFYPQDSLFIFENARGAGRTFFYNPLTREKRVAHGSVQLLSHDLTRCVLERDQRAFLCATPLHVQDVSENEEIRGTRLSGEFYRNWKFSPNDALLLNDSSFGDCRMFDGNTGDLLWEHTGAYRYSFFGNEYVSATSALAAFNRILDARTGRTLLTFSELRGRGDWKKMKDVSFAHHAGNFLTLHDMTEDEKNEVVLWKRTRPAGRLGVAWLPEFWLTVVLFVGLVWSIIRDRRDGGMA